MNLIFIGPPGAGKGTQSEMICRDFGVVQLSTGDILRANRKNGTQLGIEAQKFMNNGELVPDSIIIDMIQEELNKPNVKNGYLLDGFPRTVPQATALDSLLASLNQKIDAVLILKVPSESLLERLSGRRICKTCGKSYHITFNPPKVDNICDHDGGELYQRDDDKEEAILNRLKVYDNLTFPLIQYYSQKRVTYDIEGTRKIDEIYNSIKDILIKLK
jgi:adenylate kinase